MQLLECWLSQSDYNLVIVMSRLTINGEADLTSKKEVVFRLQLRFSCVYEQ